mmetsp:Transcript_76451/g.216379  ORF Transcript_76451/g.216379 Transcript_76451/m.216379 type:complete len:203 (-) Transcript_76451:1970-2578(-)
MTVHSTKAVAPLMAGQPFFGFGFAHRSPCIASAAVMPMGSMLRVKVGPSVMPSPERTDSSDATFLIWAIISAKGPLAAAALNSLASTLPLPSESSSCQASSFWPLSISADTEPLCTPSSSSSIGKASSLSISPLPSMSYFWNRMEIWSSNGFWTKGSRLSFSTASMMPGGVKEAWLTQLTGSRTSGFPSSGTIVRTHEELMI